MFPDDSTIETLVERELLSVTVWFQSNKLTVNSEKYDAFLFEHINRSK